MIIFRKLTIILIIISAVFLRLYMIEDNFLFTGEVGHNLLAIKDFYLNKSIPLVGPPTSHEWLYFGPLFYWVYGPILIFSNFNPLSHAYFGASISILTLIANYKVISVILDKRTAIVSSFLMSVSPLFLEFSRAGRFFSIVSLLVYPFLYYLYRIANGDKKYLFRLGFIFGCMFSFHFTPLMLIPFSIFIMIYRKISLNKEELLRSLSGIALPFIPFLIYDYLHGLSMTKNILLWIPYRILGFIGLYPKNTVSKLIIKENIFSTYKFISESFVIKDYHDVGLLIVIFFSAYFVLQIIRIIRSSKNSYFPVFFIFLWFLWGIIAVFIHGSPPIHYFVPILSAPIIIVSYALCHLPKFLFIKYIFIIAFSSLLLANFSYYFSDNWFYKNDQILHEPLYIPYTMQQKAVKEIVMDSKSEKFTLQRVGKYDQFEGDYAQNYKYLLWLYGNEPVNKANLSYTIYEDKFSKSRLGNLDKLINIEGITIVKVKSK